TVRYFPLDAGAGGTNGETTESLAWEIAPTPGNWRNLRIRLKVAPGAGTTRTFKVRKNGVDTGVAVNIVHPATYGEDLVNDFDVVAGDRLDMYLGFAGGAPVFSHIAWGLDWTPAIPGEYIHMGTSTGALDT
ncbi:unnamed protein product, partial [marine sediment metagenome]